MDKQNLRARYHFQPRGNWMNDPNGPVYLKNGLHLFYQYNPKSAVWGNMTWGHAVSSDLLHWKHLPCALHPDQPYDKDGVFSGCCVLKDGLPHILYTGTDPQVQCLAVGDALGEAFHKYESNPILDKAPVDGMRDFRDPFVWKEGDIYRLAVGGGYKGEGGVVFGYKSEDLIHWQYTGEIARGNDPKNDVWECPNLLIFPDGHAQLLLSLIGSGGVYALEGSYADGKLIPTRKLYRYDLGDSYYAPNSFYLPDGRLITLGWLRETVPGREGDGWQGMMSLLREVYRAGDGTVAVRPLKELERLREGRLLTRRNFTVHAGENPLKEIHGRRLEILLRFEAGADELCLELCKSPRGEEKAVLTYDGGSDYLEADCSRAGGNPTPCGGFVAGKGLNELHIYLDGSALEVYFNKQDTLSTRVYPSLAESDGLRLYARGAVRVLEMQIYNMGSAYADDNLPLGEEQ